MNLRPEAKVIAAAGGAGVVSGLVLGALGVTVFHVPFDAAHSDEAISAVPAWLSLPITAGVTFLAGYLAPRTSDAERGVSDLNADLDA